MLILSGCASTDDISRLQYDIIQLRSEINNMEKQMPGQGGQLNNRLTGLEEEQKARSNAVSDLFMKVQTLTAELQAMTGRFDKIQYLSENSLKKLAENKDELDSRIKELEQAVKQLNEKLAGLESEKPSHEKQKPAEDVKEDSIETLKSKEVEKDPGKEIKDVYMDAYKAYKENNFSESRKKFLSLLTGYPENEYSDNARFWIGETYFKKKNYEDAILAFEELLKNNPGSDKVPGAMLKQGLAFYELKDEETGKIILEQLIEKFPDSELAETAKKKINPAAPSKKHALPPKKKL